MSAELLAALQRANAFEAAPVLRELHELHVPFDDLLVGEPGASAGWERALDAALRRRERVAVVGASGEGKSSLMQYVLRPTVEGLFPLPIPVALADPSVVTDPVAFAGHVVAMVRRHVGTSLPQLAPDVPAPRTEQKVGWSVTPEVMGVKLGVAREVESVADEAPRSGADNITTARMLIEVIESADLRATLVLDDTDKWVRGSSGQVDQQLRDDFFGKIVRVIAEHLGCAAAIAVHRSYLGDLAYREAASGFLSASVEVPRLTTVAAVRSVLEHRQRVAQAVGAPGEPVAAVWSPDAVLALHARYETQATSSMRWLLQLAHLSLALACDAGAERIEELHVEAAWRELHP